MFDVIMSNFYKNKKFNINTLLVPCICAFCLSYLLYHTFSGERGGLALIQLNSSVEKIQKELDTVRFERISLEHRVKMLRNDSLDKDLLDEKVRENLGRAHPTEDVYYLQRH